MVLILGPGFTENQALTLEDALISTLLYRSNITNVANGLDTMPLTLDEKYHFGALLIYKLYSIFCITKPPRRYIYENNSNKRKQPEDDSSDE